MFFIFWGSLSKIEVGTQSTKVLVEMAAHMKISLDPQCADVPIWTSKWVLQVTVVSLVSPMGKYSLLFCLWVDWTWMTFPCISMMKFLRFLTTTIISLRFDPSQGSGSRRGPIWMGSGWQLHSWSSCRGRRGRMDKNSRVFVGWWHDNDNEHQLWFIWLIVMVNSG